MDRWRLILSSPQSGEANMAADRQMFSDFEAGLIPSTLRIYSWKPRCITVGYSQELISKPGWDSVKRPTGGGIVFHNEAEVTYSLVTAIDNPLLPAGLIPSYKKISEAVIIALAKIGIVAELQTENLPAGRQGRKPKSKSKYQNANPQMCFSYPAEYEIVVEERKIVGSAQKRGKRTLLQQGSIFVQRNEFDDIKEAVSVEEVLGRVVGFEEMSRALVSGFELVLGMKFELNSP